MVLPCNIIKVRINTLVLAQPGNRFVICNRSFFCCLNKIFPYLMKGRYGFLSVSFKQENVFQNSQFSTHGLTSFTEPSLLQVILQVQRISQDMCLAINTVEFIK
ncbi:hypothetical protein V8G54_034467 [Vigna mungo]|uniref:Uncharacterized protein n=1 Tax=Vigna mungo TaxID=3915 RepID=A0AAQ3MPS6_VIGMU